MLISFSSLKKILFGLFIVIVLGHIASTIIMVAPNATHPETGINLLYDLFYFEHEKNLTALFSGLLFIILGLFFYNISTIDKPFKSSWKLLTYVSCYLGCDEWFAIHDTVWNIKGKFLGVQYWIWIYAFAAVMLVIYLLPFLFKMDKKIRLSLILSGTVFIFGAGIFETLNPHYGFDQLTYQIYLLLEDGFEMLGVLIAIIGCMAFLSRFNVTQVEFPKKTSFTIGAICFLDLIITHFIRLN